MPTCAVVILALIHVLLCIVLVVLAARGVLRARPSCMALALFVPVFGPVGIALLERKLRDKDARCEEFDIEELRVNDAVHKSILMEQSTVGDSVVPLQDALLLDDASTRRELIMDVLYEGAHDQPHALRAARGNDDPEVVHYATTALVELQKTYDDAMAAAETACEKDPHDARAARDRADVLRDYVASGLLEGNMLTSVRARYAEALDAWLDLVPAGSSQALDACVRAFDNAQERGDDVGMRRYADLAEARWPRREEGHLMRLHRAAARGDRAGVDAELAELTSGDVRLSARGRREVAYWRLPTAPAAPAPATAPAPAAPAPAATPAALAPAAAPAPAPMPGTTPATPAPASDPTPAAPAPAPGASPAPAPTSREGGAAHAR